MVPSRSRTGADQMMRSSWARLHRYGMNGIAEGVEPRGIVGESVPNVEHALATAGTGVPTSGRLRVDA